MNNKSKSIEKLIVDDAPILAIFPFLPIIPLFFIRRIVMRLVPILTAMTLLIVMSAETARACKEDIECKGDRICKKGRCVDAPQRLDKTRRCKMDTECLGDDICEENICIAPSSSASTASSKDRSPDLSQVSATPTAPLSKMSPATHPSPSAKGGASAVANTKDNPSELLSISFILALDSNDMLGVSAHADATTDSSLVLGATYSGLFYSGDADISVRTQVYGINVGVRAGSVFIARVGAGFTLTDTEIMHMKDTSFGAVLLASADLRLGYLLVGWEAWINDGSLNLLRLGIAF